MNTCYLKYAVEIEQTGSITRAAQKLYMAQPNLSKAIKDLETDLGYDIFKRSAGGIKVTEKGSEFLYHAHKVLEQMEEIEKIGLHDAAGIRKFKISIPRGSYIANGFTQFVANMPMTEGVEITVNETNTAKTLENVVNRGYNMGIIRYRKDYQDYFEKYLASIKLEYETIWEFEYVLVMSQQHPLASKTVINGSDLKDYVKITHGDIEMPGRNIHEEGLLAEKATDAGGKTIYVYERGSQFDLLTNVPTTYMWVSPLPQKHLEQYHLVQRACRVPDNLYRDVLVYRKDYKLLEYDILFQKKLYESKVEVASVEVI